VECDGKHAIRGRLTPTAFCLVGAPGGLGTNTFIEEADMPIDRVLKILVVAAFAVCALLVEPASAHTLGQVRRVSRRTGRRTTRRVAARRLFALPVGYTTVVRAGTTYYVSGGVYYVQRMDAGTTVYVEVSM
jgi:hypothetical protein